MAADGHVIDPRTGVAVDTPHSAVVTGPSSLECDALSPALLVLAPRGCRRSVARFPGTTTLSAEAATLV